MIEFDNPTVANVQCKAVQLTYDDVDLTLYENVTSQAWIMSLKHFHIDYAWHELKKYRLRFFKKIGLHLIVLLKSLCVALAKTEQVVYLNHDYHDTSAPLSKEKLKWLSSHMQTELQGRFKNKALVIRSLNELDHATDLQKLGALGFCPIASRYVYYFNPAISATSKLRYDLKRDLKLTLQFGYVTEEVKALSKETAERLAALYECLYIQKHTALNPHYTPHFFQSCADTGRYTFLLFKQNEQIVGFCMFQELENQNIKAYCMGYDISLPMQQGLYRQIMSTMLDKSVHLQKPLYLSAGASRFKRNRKCAAHAEFYMVYYQHLSLLRRIGWVLLASVVQKLWLQGIKGIF